MDLTVLDRGGYSLEDRKEAQRWCGAHPARVWLCAGCKPHGVARVHPPDYVVVMRYDNGGGLHCDLCRQSAIKDLECYSLGDILEALKPR